VLEKDGSGYFVNFGHCSVRLPASVATDERLADHVDDEVVLGVRPESISDNQSASRLADTMLDAQVEVVEMMGSEAYLYLDYEGHKLTAKVPSSTRTRMGESVRIAIDTGKVHLFDKKTQDVIFNAVNAQ
jgi:multiple sugar transport system ATP-binding protein